MRRDEEYLAFFEAEADGLQRFAAFMCGDPDRAADLAQEALLRTYRQWGRIRSEAPGPYARRIIVNEIRSAARREKVRRLRPAPTFEAEVVRESEVEDWIVVADALATLSPIRRATIVLRFYEDMTEAGIAELLDRPLGTVKSDIHRALKDLRPLLHREDAKERR